jgi:gamma-glutamylcyclotransferase (GGCT)/AIG2-like uncharacterized protein YtfP
MKLYFAYGANLNMDGMAHRCPGAVAIQPFYLDDYRLAFSGVATIQPSPGDRVAGGLWAITEECEASLDCFEGFPTMYRKETVTVEGMEIMFYVMNSDPPQPPDPGYLMTIARGYQHFGLDLEDLDDAVRTTQEEHYDLHRSTPSGTRFSYALENAVPF